MRVSISSYLYPSQLNLLISRLAQSGELVERSFEEFIALCILDKPSSSGIMSTPFIHSVFPFSRCQRNLVQAREWSLLNIRTYQIYMLISVSIEGYPLSLSNIRYTFPTKFTNVSGGFASSRKTVTGTSFFF